MSETIISTDEIIAQFLASAEMLEALVKDLPEAMLDCSEAPGEWSIRQIVHHVADDGDLWCLGLKKAVAVPGANLRFEGFPGNGPWSRALAFDRRPIGPALAILRGHRAVMADLARECAGDWENRTVAILDDQGKLWQNMSVGQILPMLTKHALEHVETVKRIRGM